MINPVYVSPSVKTRCLKLTEGLSQLSSLERAFKLIEQEFRQAKRARRESNSESDQDDGSVRERAARHQTLLGPAAQGEPSDSSFRDQPTAMPLPTFDPVTINNLIQPGSSSLEQRMTASRRGLPGQLATSGSPFPGGLRVPSTSSHALLDLQPPIGTVQDVSPETVRSQTSWHEGGDESNDGGLANPVRLLAEAAEEASSGTGGYGEQMGAIRPSSERPPVLPPQYMLPDTMASLLHEGSVDPRIAGLSLDLDFLAQGLQALVAPTARQSLSAEDKAFFKPPKKMVKRDLGADCDPIDLALITETEANAFFDIYFQRLHPLLSVLDPELHKPACEPDCYSYRVHC